MAIVAPVSTLQPASPPSGLTYEEFLEWADEDIHAEWIDGEIIVMSPASSRHQRLNIYLGTILECYVDFHQLGSVFGPPFQMKPAAELPGREPDLLFVAAANEHRIKDNHLDGPADLAVEIVSRESRTRDTIDKFNEYEAGGVAEYWILDPERQEARFYVLREGRYVETKLSGTFFESAILKGFRLDVSTLWQKPLPSVWQTLDDLGLRGGAPEQHYSR